MSVRRRQVANRRHTCSIHGPKGYCICVSVYQGAGISYEGNISLFSKRILELKRITKSIIHIVYVLSNPNGICENTFSVTAHDEL